jgi:hypothetical protein
MGAKKRSTNKNAEVKERRSKTSLAATNKDKKDEAGTMTKTNNASSSATTMMSAAEKEQLRALHLAPLPLVLVVLVCSGFLWMLAFRDVMATGRPILGAMDEAMLVSQVLRTLR